MVNMPAHLFLAEIISLGSHRAEHIPFSCSFLKELRVMLKTQ